MADHSESAATLDDAQLTDVPDGHAVVEKPDCDVEKPDNVERPEVVEKSENVEDDRDGDTDAVTGPVPPDEDETPLAEAESVDQPDVTDLDAASSTDADDAPDDDAPDDDAPDDDAPDDDAPDDDAPDDDAPAVDGADVVEAVTDGEPKDGEPEDGEPKDGEPKDGEPEDGEPKDDEPPAVATQVAPPDEAELSPVALQLAALMRDPSVVERLTVAGPAQVLPSVFQVTTVAATAVAAAALGAARLSAARNGGPEPTVTVDTRHAAIAFRSERYITANRRPLPNPWSPLSGYYRTADDRWIQLHCNFPHHQDGVLSLFGLPPDRTRLERAVSLVEAEVLEGELQSMGMCATVSRTAAEWRAHPQGRALGQLPLLEIDRIGEAPPLAFVPSAKPAAGVRVLDMTRVIAGPVCGRVLASYGARVVRVGAAHLPEVATLLVDTGFGKRNTNLDLREPAGARRLRELVSSADVVIQAYRPKALARLGFGPEALARLRPGLVCVSISAYGRLGPWSGLRGFDSLVQTTSGVAHAGGAAYDAEPEAASHDPAVQPVPLPAQALDHATGYLGAYGALTALARRQTEGGSWHVRLSLAQTGRWLQELGPADALGVAEPGLADVEPWLGKIRSGLGELAYVRPPGALSSYTPQWDTPPTPLGSAPPSWG